MKFSIAKGQTTTIDAEDYDRVSKYRWNFNNGAVTTNIKLNNSRRTTMKLHRFILNLPPYRPIVDHINGNPLDNRKRNLRTCTGSQNKMNSNKHRDNKSGFKGVSWSKAANKWVVTIGLNYKQYYIGLFESKDEAYEQYKKAAKKLHGEFAKC